MDTLKEVVSFLGTLVGFLTALATLYAMYVDRKNRNQRKESPAELDLSSAVIEDSPPRPVVRPVPRSRAAVSVAVLDVLPVLPVERPSAERARQMVKAPAIALICVGFLAMSFNILVACYGFVDEFVTPLNPPPADHQGNHYVAPRGGRSSDSEGTAVLTIFTMLGFSLAGLIAIGAGFSMIRLRGYWLSMAGSFAIMPAACFCFLAGFPVGVWCLVTLLRPEVSGSFT